MTNAHDPMEEGFERTEAELRAQIDLVRERIQALDAQARRAVQEKPLIAVGSALLLGYALGRLFARR
jgi:ElaB/YqjD/DUF883 family membrane-anchored ribosome-binding protein